MVPFIFTFKFADDLEGGPFLANYVHRTGTSQRPASQICSCIKAFLVAHGTSKLYGYNSF